MGKYNRCSIKSATRAELGRIKDGKRKIELKVTEGEYERPSSLFQKLYFSAQNEVENFEKGETLIARVFLIDNSILKNGARFEKEFRAKITGAMNYTGSIKEIKVEEALA